MWWFHDNFTTWLLEATLAIYANHCQGCVAHTLPSVHEVMLGFTSGEQVNTFLEVFLQHAQMATYATVEGNYEDYR